MHNNTGDYWADLCYSIKEQGYSISKPQYILPALLLPWHEMVI